MKILIADDDPVSRRLMQRMLQRNGYEVVAASDGRAASRELLSPTGPKLALVDWMMPELDGPGVCRAVRSRNDDSYVYILLLTSKEAHEDIVQGLEAGADDYLTKPCHPAELNARLLTGRRILELEEKLVEAREQMRFRATHDGLTELLNRTAIIARLELSLKESYRGGVPLAVLLCDVDHFKQVNDLYGHPTGDAVLQELANRLKSSVREADWVGRYGGEEFMLILNDCDSASLNQRVEDIRRAIVAKPFQTDAGLLSITASFGALSVDQSGDIEALGSLVAATDSALYEAKRRGRNRVELARPRQAAPDALTSVLRSSTLNTVAA